MLNLLAKFRTVETLLAHDTPKADDDSRKARDEGSVVGGLVAAKAVGTIAVTVVAHHGVSVEDAAIEQIENISTEDGSERHDAPVLRESADPEGVRDKRREDAEQETVGDAGESGDHYKLMGIRYRRPGKLRHGEHDGRDEQAPESGHVQFLDKNIGPNSCRGG